MSRSILEVWDYRLSTAQPINHRGAAPQADGELLPCLNWVACVYSQDESNALLECHDTGVPVEAGDTHDGKGLDACFSFYRSVRDKYSRPEIEALKPAVAAIRVADAARQEATDAYNEKLLEIEGQ